MFPGDIIADTQNIYIGSLVEKIDEEKIPYPYTSSFRSIKEKSRMIELLFLKIPLPEIYLLKNKEDNKCKYLKDAYIIEDILEFIDNSFELQELEFFNEFNGQKFKDLPFFMQRRIYEAYLVIKTINFKNNENFESYLKEIIR